MSVTHVLFDFFGTLVEYSPSRTEQGYPRSFARLREAGSGLDYAGFLALWSETAEALDAEAERSGREFSMQTLARAFLERAVPRPDASLVRDFVGLYLEEWNAGVRYHAALPPMLDRLGERFTLGIVTNTHDATLVHGHLARMGVADRFRAVVTSVEHGMRKPGPSIFEHALAVVGARAERCLYVGDDPAADYRGARGAGMRAMLIDPGDAHGVAAVDRLGSILDLERRLVERPGEAGEAGVEAAP